MNLMNAQPFDVWADLVAKNDARLILNTMEPLFACLTEMHAKGQAHGNIEPKNLVVSGDNTINCATFQAAKSQMMVQGSEYAPPEAHHDPPPAPTIAGDVYAIAAVLYRAIAGQSPMRAINRVSHNLENLKMNCAVGILISQGINKGLALQPDSRPGSVEEFHKMFGVTNKPPTQLPTVKSEGRERITEARYSSEPRRIISHGQITQGTPPTAQISTPLSVQAILPPVAAPVKLETLAVERIQYAPGTKAPEVATPSAPPASTVPQSHSPSARPNTPIPPAPTVAKRLPINLTVGRAVEIPIAKLVADPGAWKIKLLNGEELGLALDRNKTSLNGIPKLAGEHELRLELTLLEASERPPLFRSIAVTINPDPDSLWKNLPSDDKDPYFKPDTDQKSISTPEARIIAASLRGRSHAHEGLFRDDDFRVRYDEASAWHLLAAADGAGSAKYARRGSQIACEQAVAFMGNWLTEHKTTLDTSELSLLGKADKRQFQNAAYAWLGGAAFAARKAIQLEADQQIPTAALRDYHTTLLLAASKHTAHGWVVATFSIGDGGIAMLQSNGEPKALCTPDSGDFGGQTVFLTVANVLTDADKIMSRIHIELVPDLSALVLMTDGVTDPRFPTEVSLSDFNTWKSFWSDLTGAVSFQAENSEADTQLLKWLSFRSPGNHDDRTIVLLKPLAALASNQMAFPKSAESVVAAASS